MDCEWPGVIRSKGLFWLATRPGQAGYWSQAGALCRNERLGFFWCKVPESEWPPEGSAARNELDHHWEEPHGDQRQEIVLIGSGMDQEALTAMLDGALLTIEEFADGPDSWENFSDPFPAWTDPEPAEMATA